MFSKKNKAKLINIYPPYFFSGIRLKEISDDFCYFKVQLRLRWWNKNIFGTHFGGSLYSMCDPFFVFILVNTLGEGYTVWDKAASIKFLKPGTGNCTAEFYIPPEKVESIKADLEKSRKQDYFFTTQVKNEQGEIVAEVEKLVYVRRRIGKHYKKKKN